MVSAVQWSFAAGMVGGSVLGVIGWDWWTSRE